MTNYVIINGVNSNTINGLGINELPPITKPQMRVQNEEIDGRDGDITTNLGYSAYDKTITIGLFGTGYDINDIVAFFNGEGTIVFSNEADKYYNFKIINQIDYVALQKFKTATITFHCQPFKYPLTETPLEIEYSYIEDEGESLTLNDTGESTLELNLKGNTSQTGTPTPSTPIDVNVVSGDNEVVVCGKNLLNKESVTNGKLVDRTNGTLVNSGGFKASDYIQVKSGQTYTQSNCDSWYSVYYDTNKNYLGICGTNTFTPSQDGYIRTSIPNAKIDIAMIEVGSSASTYEPYQSQTYEVDLPVENLISSKSVSGSNLFLNGATSKTSFVFKAGTYTINANASTNYSVYTKVSGGDDVRLGGINELPVTFTRNEDFNLWIYGSGITADSVSNLQLEKGTKANHYTPYGTTPIELCKIGTYQDYFTKNSDGQWCKYNAIGKYTFTGNENWGTHSYGTNSWENGSIISTTYDSSNTQIISNVFRGIAQADRATSGDNIIFTVSNTNFVIRNTILTTQAQVQSATNGKNIYYQLATPYLSLIEDNNLIEQLDNLQNAMSYEGTTNINQVNDDKAFIISTKALEQGSNEVVVNNIGNAYSKPLIALEGSGNVDIYLGNTQILKANVEDKMNIDIAKLEAYNPDTSVLLNRQVIGNYNSMILQPGNNTIRIDGALDKATISNYTRWL